MRETCWIIHQFEGEGVIADNDGNDLMFRTRMEAEHFLVTRVLLSGLKGFGAELFPAEDWIAAATGDGRGVKWYEPDELTRLELGME